MQAKLPLEISATSFFNFYFTFLFIQSFVPFSLLNFFYKAVVIFFVCMSRTRAQSMSSVQFKKKLFLVR